MSFAAVCTWSFLRSVLVALAAAFISKPLAESVTSWRAPSVAVVDRQLAIACGTARFLGRRFIWGLLLTPFLVPPLLVGYAYYRPALMLVHYPRTTEAVYCFVLFLRFFAAAMLIRVFAPPRRSRPRPFTASGCCDAPTKRGRGASSQMH